MNIRNFKVHTNNHVPNFLDKVSIQHFVYYRQRREPSLYEKEVKKDCNTWTIYMMVFLTDPEMGTL